MEKQYSPTKVNKKAQKALVDTEKIAEAPVKKAEKTEEKSEIKTEKQDEKKTEIKKPVKKIKKEEVTVNAKGVHVSTKFAVNICKFIKGKRIGDAIRDLEQVVLLKKPVPMKGEYAHQKGKGISGARFPQRSAKQFIVLLKSLAGNANNHEINEPVISMAMANIAQSPRGQFGRIKRKRTHITLKAKEMKTKKSNGGKK